MSGQGLELKTAESEEKGEEERINLSELPFEEYLSNCEILTSYSIDSLFTFQTPKHIYVAANNKGSNNFTIYNHKCSEVAQIAATIISTACDRKFCDHGIAVFIAESGEILSCN